MLQDDSGQVQVFDERETLKEKPLIPPPTQSSEDSEEEEEEEMLSASVGEYVVISSQTSYEAIGRVEDPVESTSLVVTPPSPDVAVGDKSLVGLAPVDMKKSSSTASFLSGVWRHRRDEDTISVSSDRSQVDGEDEIDGVMSTVAPESEITFEVPERNFVVETNDASEGVRIYVDVRPTSPSLTIGTDKNEEESLSPSGRYIYLAAEVVGSAQEAEARGDFRTAFVKFKAAIGILLEGVQSKAREFN